MITNLFSKKKDYNLPYSQDGRPMRYATLNERNIAAMIDFVLLSFILMPISNILEILFKVDKHKISNQYYTQQLDEIRTMPANEQITKTMNLLSNMYSIQSIIIFLIIVIILAYIFFFFWNKYQTTPGGMFMSLRVIDENTFERVDAKHYMIRAFIGIISTIPLFIGFLSVLYSKKKQAWHDKVAHTVVVSLGKPLK